MTDITKKKQYPNPCFYMDDFLSKDSGWNYDNRNYTGSGGGQAGDVICAAAQQMPVSVNRCFRACSSGLLTMELQIFLTKHTNGIFFRFSNKKDKHSLELVSKDGYLYCGSSKIDVKFENCVDGDAKLCIRMNLDSRKAEIYLNGVFGGSFDMNNYPIEKFEMGINAGGTAYFSRGLVRLFADYPVNEIFMMTPSDKLPVDFEFDGSFCIEKRSSDSRGNDKYSMKIDAKAGTSHKAVKRFSPVCGKSVARCFMLLDKAQSGSYFSFNCQDNAVVKISTEGNSFVTSKGQFLRKYTDFIWQIVKIEADTETQKAVVYIDGKEIATIDFDCKAEFFDSVTVGFDAQQDAQMWFDDIQVYCYEEPEDYVPEPVVPESLGYYVGLNVCPMWREGRHFGWDRISPHADLVPVIGFYEEGNRESADWEIKYMVEHGINCQHICWFDNYGMVNNPLKQSFLDSSLNEGFFYAKYSHLMKFCLMWENTGVGCENLEQFKTYIWNYWKDYYFSDPRYMAIDNKPVMTMYNFNNFKKAFGSFEETKKAIEFMNEDIKSLGYDGMIILVCGGNISSESFFKEVVDIGAQGVYAYHWFINGKDAEYQINRMNTIKSYNTAYLVPTISTGFNNLGWSDVRKPIISLEGFEKVADYIKNEYLPQFDSNTWQSKIVLLSNWNEYGEGTYLMPAGVHGFDYLDIIRKYFTKSDSVPHNDVVPTQAQKDRISNLYSDDRSPIKARDYEKVEQTKTKLYANGRQIKLRFEPEKENGELYAVCEPREGFFTKLALYHEYSRFSGRLLIKSKNATVEFTTGSNIALVNSEKVTLNREITVFDGLPVLPMRFLMSSLGYAFVEDESNNTYYICTAGDKHLTEIISQTNYEWNWTIPGEKMGWGNNSISLFDDNDCLGGLAFSNAPFGVGVLDSCPLNIRVKQFSKIKMRIKYKLKGDSTSIKIAFASPKDKSVSDASFAEWDLGANSSDGKYVEIEAELASFNRCKRYITALRFDFGRGSEFYIDYIRFIEDPDFDEECEDQNEAIVYNGDASDAGYLSFFSSSAEVTICEAPDNAFNYVFFVKSKNFYSYARQSLTYSPNITYVAEFDVRIISEKPADVFFNAVYWSPKGEDHVVGGVRGTYDDGWLHFKGEFTVEDFGNRSIDQFALFSNPVDGKGVSFYFDNAKIYVK